MSQQLNLITLDIETSARVGLFFGNTYNANIAKVVQEMYVFGFSWKPLGKKVRSCYVWDFPLYKKEPMNDIEVIKKWCEVVSGAIVIGHNSRSFDDKVMMGRVMIHQLPPPVPFTTIDTKADAKKVARFDSNKLDDRSKQYGSQGKNDTGGIDLWWQCMLGNPKAQSKMVRYCERDVMETEKLYKKDRPYYKNHPALNILAQRPNACKVCLSERIKDEHTHVSAKLGLYRYHSCMSCGHRMKARTPEFYVAIQDRAKYL